MTKSLRKKLGWLVAIGAVLGMVSGNFDTDTALSGVLFDLIAMAGLALGMVLIVA
jgi:hypothetical protein